MATYTAWRFPLCLHLFGIVLLGAWTMLRLFNIAWRGGGGVAVVATCGEGAGKVEDAFPRQRDVQCQGCVCGILIRASHFHDVNRFESSSEWVRL